MSGKCQCSVCKGLRGEKPWREVDHRDLAIVSATRDEEVECLRREIAHLNAELAAADVRINALIEEMRQPC